MLLWNWAILGVLPDTRQFEFLEICRGYYGGANVSFHQRNKAIARMSNPAEIFKAVLKNLRLLRHISVLNWIFPEPFFMTVNNVLRPFRRMLGCSLTRMKTSSTVWQQGQIPGCCVGDDNAGAEPHQAMFRRARIDLNGFGTRDGCVRERHNTVAYS